MRKHGLFLFLFIVVFFPVYGQSGYPSPPKSDNMLFFLQRSHNRNTVIYELNLLGNGKLIKDKPVKYYWIRYEEGGKRSDLSFIQNQAYGLKCKLTDEKKDNYTLHFNHFKNRDIFLLVNSAGKHRAYMYINNELTELEKVFIKAEGYSNGKPLKIHFIEFQGISVESNKRTTERVFP